MPKDNARSDNTSSDSGREVISLNRLARDAGFDNVHHAIMAFGLKTYEPESYQEISVILETMHRKQRDSGTEAKK